MGKRTVRLSLLRVLVVLAVVAGTFPWDMQNHPHWFKVAWVPFASGIVRPLDLVANLLLYFPLGYLMAMHGGRFRVTLVVIGALLLASCCELAQVWSHSRIPSATDVVANAVGSLVGAVLATRRRRAEQRHVSPDPSSA